MNPLRITIVQSQLHWEDTAANLQMFTDKLTHVSDTDLIVLPETFSTGFSMQAVHLAEGMDGTAVNWMRKTAAEKNAVITGSLIIKEGNEIYNRLIWMQPDGKFNYYNKRHRFSIGGEGEVFTAGAERIIVELNGWKICPLICYDLRFPVWSRNTAEDGYDVLLYVANWPERRIQAWKYLLVARAIENQCYTVGVNCIGTDGNDIYSTGDSMVIDALGNIVYHSPRQDDIHTVELSYADLQKLRTDLPFLKDADSFEVNPHHKFKSH